MPLQLVGFLVLQHHHRILQQKLRIVFCNTCKIANYSITSQIDTSIMYLFVEGAYDMNYINIWCQLPFNGLFKATKFQASEPCKQNNVNPLRVYVVELTALHLIIAIHSTSVNFQCIVNC